MQTCVLMIVGMQRQLTHGSCYFITCNLVCFSQKYLEQLKDSLVLEGWLHRHSECIDTWIFGGLLISQPSPTL